jgi:hypothetical protein
MEMALPYNEVRLHACQVSTANQREEFLKYLKSLLHPFLIKLHKKVTVALLQTNAPLSPYHVVLVGYDNQDVCFSASLFQSDILTLADESGASRTIFEAENGLVIAILNQRRYWTRSRARLCAGEIILRHMSVFENA